ncbi:MAG TPA: hypothetical protein DDZ99_06305 [Clostridiales bacterium]|nr:hypothetical protein [Clostridiales bacterium]
MEVSMFLLEKNAYSKVISIFSNMFDYDITVKMALTNNQGFIYVDDLVNPETAYIEMEWGFYYLSGKYNDQFLNTVINHILIDIVPKQTIHDMAFIFSDSDIWLNVIDQKLVDYEHSKSKRLNLKLNKEKFLQQKSTFEKLPENYELQLNTEEEKVDVLYMGNWIGCCERGSTGTIAECDVFLKENHRQKGIATLMCTKFIEYHLSQGNELTWSCWEANVPSCKLAIKLGFELYKESYAITAKVK